MDKRKRGFRGSIPLLILEICVLLIAIGVMNVVVTMTSEVNHKNIDEAKIRINEEIVRKKTTDVKQTEKKEEEKKKGYRNIALFGVDARDGELGRGTRSWTCCRQSWGAPTTPSFPGCTRSWSGTQAPSWRTSGSRPLRHTAWGSAPS